MLRSYNAELNGSQLRWLDDVPPYLAGHHRALVVVDDAPTQPVVAMKRYDFSDLVGRLKWRGDAVSEQRAQRDAW